VFVLAKAAGMVVVAVEGGWGATNHTQVQVSEGETAVVLDLLATASQVDLWWPNGVGRQPLYNVSAKVGNSSAVATRRIGFRTFALVTGGGTPPGDQGATLTNGMYFRVNGASVFSKGANMIPMEEMEGRMRADAHRTLIQSAAHGGMNTLRVWGGGIFLPGVWFDACDELGVMVYHDMMYPGHKEHAPANTTDQELEVRHNVRRLGHHPSIVIWDGQNSDDWDPNVEEVMTWVAQEDQSRTVWPACQSAGWLSGVDPATSRPLVPLVPLVPRLPVAHRIGPGGFGTMMEYHGPYVLHYGMRWSHSPHHTPFYSRSSALFDEWCCSPAAMQVPTRGRDDHRQPGRQRWSEHQHQHTTGALADRHGSGPQQQLHLRIRQCWDVLLGIHVRHPQAGTLGNTRWYVTRHVWGWSAQRGAPLRGWQSDGTAQLPLRLSHRRILRHLQRRPRCSGRGGVQEAAVALHGGNGTEGQGGGRALS
jgi:hypothetical protein